VRVFVVAAAAACGALLLTGWAEARLNSYRASVIPPPKIQRAGHTYKLRVTVRNTGSAVHPFCLDFTDDHGSWSIEMPGLASYDSDTFCMRRVLGAGVRKTLTAYVIAAKSGRASNEHPHRQSGDTQGLPPGICYRLACP
jgi:hypothetical protein